MADSTAFALHAQDEVAGSAAGPRARSVARRDAVLVPMLLWACLAAAPAAAAGTATVDSLSAARSAIVDGDYATALGIAHRESVRRLSATRDSVACADALLVELEARWRGGLATAPETRALAAGLIAVLDRRAAPEDSTLATSLLFGGIVERRSGGYDAAQGWIDRAVAIRSRIYGPEHPLVRQAQVSEANLLIDREDYVGAGAILEPAMTARRASCASPTRCAASRSRGSAAGTCSPRNGTTRRPWPSSCA